MQKEENTGGGQVRKERISHMDKIFHQTSVGYYKNKKINYVNKNKNVQLQPK